MSGPPKFGMETPPPRWPPREWWAVKLQQILAISFIAALIVWGVIHCVSVLSTDTPPSPSKEFVDGFEKGVRYGLIAKTTHPDEDSIPELTKEAVRLYYFTLVHQAKCAAPTSFTRATTGHRTNEQ